MIDFLRHQARAFRARLAATRYRNMGLQDVFEEIYGKNMWGGQGERSFQFRKRKRQLSRQPLCRGRIALHPRE